MRASGAGEKISESKRGTKYFVKKADKAKDLIARHSKTFGGTLSDSEIIKLADISRNSYYKYKAEVKYEMAK